MLACHNRSLNVFRLSSLVSLRTFVEHLSALTTTAFNPNRTNRKPLTAKAAIRTPFFDSLNPLQKEQIHLYVDTLLQWNRKVNLTAVTEASEVMERHVEDSLAILPPIRSSYSSHCEASYDNLSLVDVGSGAGLPGLILAIACPGWKVTLLESINKRCLFLEHAVGVIGLPNVQVIRERAEKFGQNLAFRETFDIAVARAVAELRILAEYCLPLVRVGGLFVAAKGHDPLEEISSAKRAIQLMGASILQIDSVESHSPYGQRTAVLCLKDRPTPKKYPRDPDIDILQSLYLLPLCGWLQIWVQDTCVMGGQFMKTTRESLSNSDTDG